MYLIDLKTKKRTYLDADKEQFTLGRHKECDLRFLSPHVSRHHCLLIRNKLSQPISFTVRNSSTNNKTYVDGLCLSEQHQESVLEANSILGLGVPLYYLENDDQDQKRIFLKLLVEEVDVRSSGSSSKENGTPLSHVQDARIKTKAKKSNQAANLRNQVEANHNDSIIILSDDDVEEFSLDEGNLGDCTNSVPIITEEVISDLKITESSCTDDLKQDSTNLNHKSDKVGQIKRKSDDSLSSGNSQKKIKLELKDICDQSKLDSSVAVTSNICSSSGLYNSNSCNSSTVIVDSPNCTNSETGNLIIDESNNLSDVSINKQNESLWDEMSVVSSPKQNVVKLQNSSSTSNKQTVLQLLAEVNGIKQCHVPVQKLSTNSISNANLIKNRTPESGPSLGKYDNKKLKSSMAELSNNKLKPPDISDSKIKLCSDLSNRNHVAPISSTSLMPPPNKKKIFKKPVKSSVETEKQTTNLFSNSLFSDFDDLPDLPDITSEMTSTPLVKSSKKKRLVNLTSPILPPSCNENNLTNKNSVKSKVEDVPKLSFEDLNEEAPMNNEKKKDENNELDSCGPKLSADNIVIKQEIADYYNDKYDYGPEELKIVYSQMDEYILLSSDEEEMISTQDICSKSKDISELSFGPIPSTSDHHFDLDIIKPEPDSDGDDINENLMNEDNLTVDDKADTDNNTDDWFPQLSQGFYQENESDEDFDIFDRKKEEISNKCETETAGETIRNSSENDSPVNQKKSPKKILERRMQMTDLILPPSVIKRKKVAERKDKNRPESKHGIVKTVVATKHKPTSKKYLKNISPLRKTVNKMNSNHILKNKLKARTVESDAASSVRNDTMNRPALPVDHKINVNEIKDGENMSIQTKKKSPHKSNAVLRGTAKVTKKNRSAGLLTDVNLFPSPPKPKPSKLIKRKDEKCNVKQSNGFNPSSSSSNIQNNPVSVDNLDVLNPTQDCPRSPVEDLPTSDISSIHADKEISNLLESLNIPSYSGTQPSNKGNLLSAAENLSKTSDKKCTEAQPSTSTGNEINDNLIPVPMDIEEEEQRCDINDLPEETKVPAGILKKSGVERNSKKNVKFPDSIEELAKIRFIEPRKDKDRLGPSSVNIRELAASNIGFSCFNKAVGLERSFMGLSLNIEPWILNSYYFIYRVCKWNYEWLKTYQQALMKGKGGIASPPPLIGNKAIPFPTLVIYDTFKDYYEVFSGLYFFEVWETIYKDYLQYHSTNTWFRCQVDKASPNFLPATVKVPPGPKPFNFMLVKCVTLLSRQQDRQGLHPHIGSLVAIRVPFKEKSTVVFGYIHEQSKYPHTMVSKELKNAIPDSFSTLAIGILVPKTPQINKDSLIFLCNISYLKSSIRIWEGLTQLPYSPVGPLVLKPSVESMAIPYKYFNYIVPEIQLDESQMNAVKAVTTSILKDQRARISLIHGPPGTGKTKTLTALTVQVYRQAKMNKFRSRILVCAPSNAAVDELTRRLLSLFSQDIKLNIVRLGYGKNRNGQSDQAIEDRRFDLLVEKNLKIALNTPQDERSRTELKRLTDAINVARNEMMNQTDPVLKKMNQDRVVDMVKRKTQFERECRPHYNSVQMNDLKRKIQQKVLLTADVITSTLGSSCNQETVTSILEKEVSVCIIDEAGQCQEPDIWLPLLTKVSKLVLVGDHQQLPPTVLSQLAHNKNLKQSLFERIYYHMSVEQNKAELIHTLKTQYRMHPSIAQFPSSHFYKGELVTPKDMEKFRTSPFMPYIVMNLMDGSEEATNGGKDIRNMREANFIRSIIESVKDELKGATVGVITPYQSQKCCLQKELALLAASVTIAINTVDAFQGGEKDVIIFSCVRAPGGCGGSIGFLSQQQRLNVALTRAKRCLILVGSMQFIASKDETWKALYKDAERRNKVCTVRKQQVTDTAYLRSKILLKKQTK